ncbi:S8 family peptidase [Halomarina oriensis]|uniref:S8 family serine peptidase n=1 Tax=Halomarina oriensis TaxID=671145 RepID=A0A6B0GLD1_9EURY|nr:S8 family peptidase [Halomarina oriensis]MWG35564.1 S8 family serine peptidase [Halomarina oriensis]
MGEDNTTRRRFLKGAAAGTAGTLLVGAANASGGRAPRRIVGTKSKAAADNAKGKAEAVGRTLDFGDIGQAVAGRFSDKAIEQLRKRRDVRYVEEDGTMHALQGKPGGGGGTTAAQTLPWGIDRVDAEVAHANGSTGAGADLAILDTGIDSNHPDLVDNLGAGRAFTRAKGNFAEDWDDDNDHGTHCAGTAGAVDNAEGVVGVSTEATLHAVKVLGKRGSGSFSDIAAGVEYVADQGWDVASMSLGGSSGTQTLRDACQYATNNGVLVVAAAGNSGPCSDCVGFPAAYPETLAVGSTDSTDDLSGFSSTGPEVDIAAPGSNINSTVPGGAYDTFSGTSMATPHVAGAAAQLMADGASNDQARSTLLNTAEDLGLGDNESGAGLLDVAAALGYDSSND